MSGAHILRKEGLLPERASEGVGATPSQERSRIMVSKRQRIKHASCVGKATYRSKQEALSFVRSYAHRVMMLPDHQMQAYECEFGEHWHCGHNRPRTMLRTLEKEFVAGSR